MQSEVTIIYILFLYAISFPTFYNYLGSAGAILVNGGLILLTFVYLLSFTNLSIQFTSKYESKLVKIFIFLFTFHLFTILISTIFSQIVIFRDFYELHRPILYTLVFISALFFFRRMERLKHLENLLIISFVIVFFLGLNHYFNIQEFISALYTKSTNIRSGRVSPPFPNPYDYSFYMLFLFGYFAIQSLKGRCIKYRLFWILSCFLSFLGIISTQSRAGIILLALQLFVIIPLVLLVDGGISLKFMIIHKKFFRYFIFMGGVITIGAFLYITYGDNLIYLISAIERLFFQQELVGSGQARVDLMEMAIERANSSFFIFIFGNGPSKSVLENPEAGYAYFIFRYGFSTLLLFFFGPLILSCFYLIKIIRQKNVSTQVYMAILAWYLSIPVAYLSSNFTEQIRLSFLYYFIMGFVIKSYFILPSKHCKKEKKYLI